MTGGNPKYLGDNYCDIAMNTTECNWDAGDCLGSNLCNVERKDYLGDSFCDGGEYNTEDCCGGVINVDSIDENFATKYEWV